MKGRKLYVGNLSHSVSAAEEEEQLKELFSSYGAVEHVNIVKGKHFGFVLMSQTSEAEKAKKELDGCEFKGHTLRVSDVGPPEARQRKRGRKPRPF